MTNPSALTHLESRVWAGVARGWNNEEIAECLQLPVLSIYWAVLSLCQKRNFRDRGAAILEWHGADLEKADSMMRAP